MSYISNIHVNNKPKIGILGIMQGLYDESYPDIACRQKKFVLRVLRRLGNIADFHFSGPVKNRKEIENVVSEFNSSSLDGIIMIMLTYSPGLLLTKALSNNNLPLLLANIQPESKVSNNWDMSYLTFNQGVHGAQDTANIIGKLGINIEVISDDWQSENFKNFVFSWSKAASAVNFLRHSKLASMGQMPGMGDILTDSSVFMNKIGPQINQVSLGLIKKNMDSIEATDIDSIVNNNKIHFELDPKLVFKNHYYAAKIQGSIQKLLEENEYSGFSIYFGAMSDDGRFRQLHMMAASNLLAQGYGYAAEGDMCCTALVSAGQHMIGNAHFTEMYAMDFEKNSVLQSHMGEGNWKIARKNRPIRLIDRKLDIGGLENPPTIVFMAEPGPATIASLVSLPNEKFRLVVAKGEILDSEELPKIEMPYFHFRPDTGVRNCLDNWLKNCGTHHQCLNLGDQRERWRMLSLILNIEYVEV